MKTRSKTLFEFLVRSNVLNGSEEDIAQAKREYRKQYKRLWKRQRAPKKEIRIECTLKEFKEIKILAYGAGLTHTAYSRTLILASVGLPPLIPHKDKLLKVLQIVSMASISSGNGIPSWQLADQLRNAEDILINYLTTK